MKMRHSDWYLHNSSWPSIDRRRYGQPRGFGVKSIARNNSAGKALMNEWHDRRIKGLCWAFTRSSRDRTNEWELPESCGQMNIEWKWKSDRHVPTRWWDKFIFFSHSLQYIDLFIFILSFRNSSVMNTISRDLHSRATTALYNGANFQSFCILWIFGIRFLAYAPSPLLIRK